MSSNLLNECDFTGLIRDIKETAAALHPGGDNREKAIFFANLVTLSYKVGKAVNMVVRDDDFAGMVLALDRFIGEGK